MSQSDTAGGTLVDVQAGPDQRGLSIDRVGVRGLSYPITVLTREGQAQSTVGEVFLAVSLPHHVRGTHMSRFIDIFERHRGEITLRTIPSLLEEMREILDAEAAEIEVAFPYFLERA
ncbi:MAG: GTP cyclohydrolase I FolE2, partial [Wenzhouxiangella sp.]|nr:GTP cyclohydrolase I FolE2 [Wenzhouxiangella sp.]